MAVSSEYFMNDVVGELLMQSLVKRMYRNGLNTHPCGTPVLMVSIGDVVEPTLTACSLSVRKLWVGWISWGGC